MSVETGYRYIVLDEKSIPMIEGTSMKVIELIAEKLAYGWSPEELHFQHPYLSLGQVHAALAYYWDHADELDRKIAESLKKVERLRKKGKREQSPLVARLKAQRLI